MGQDRRHHNVPLAVRVFPASDGKVQETRHTAVAARRGSNGEGEGLLPWPVGVPAVPAMLTHPSYAPGQGRTAHRLPPLEFKPPSELAVVQFCKEGQTWWLQRLPQPVTKTWFGRWLRSAKIPPTSTSPELTLCILTARCKSTVCQKPSQESRQENHPLPGRGRHIHSKQPQGGTVRWVH